MFVQTLARWHLQALVAEQTIPEIHVEGKMTYGSRTIWTNFALGNISSNTRIRQVCGGDFNTIRLGFRSVRHLRNQSSVRFQRVYGRRGHAAEVEVLLTLRRTVRKEDRQVGRRDAHVAQGKLVFLRMVPAGRHVVDRPL